MTKIVCLSDTHTYHDQIDVPDGDILVHAGDFCGRGSIEEVHLFLDWLVLLPHPLKIVVPGNHDICVQYRSSVRKEFLSEGIKLLIDEDYTDQRSGLTFYGMPWTPDFYPDLWAYQQSKSGMPIIDLWGQVPHGTDILISHGPPYGCRDQIETDITDHLGSVHQRSRIGELSLDLKYVICGHIHGGYGQTDLGAHGVTVVNASICTEAYRPTNPPIVLEI